MLALLLPPQIYAIGGIRDSESRAASLLERYNPKLDRWDVLPLPAGIDQMRAFMGVCSIMA